MTTRPRVVAGIAPLSPRPEVVAWAAAEAQARRAVLELVSVCPPRQADSACAAASECLHEASRRLAATCSEVEAVTRVIVGQPEHVLRAEATGADLLVVGADDHSPFVEAITGSVPGGLLTTAPCPMVVVPKDAVPAEHTAPILVGVDTADTSRAALEYGFAAADRSGRELHALLCWTAPRDRAERQAERDREHRALAVALAGYTERYPDVAVTEFLVDDDPVTELTRRARRAALLVLGSRGRGRLASMAFGSVSRTLIRSSRCPVTVARSEPTPAAAGVSQPTVHTTDHGGSR
jgi:nucleotide-binding universal stress UspA family protein